MIKENIKFINEKIEKAANKAGRKGKDITLVGVSKTIDALRVQEAVNSGIMHLGENKVQELAGKIPLIEGNVHWHLIGTLQTNKVKYIIGKVCLIHSVDRIQLAKEINKCALKNNLVQDILLQINIGNEETKHGFSYDEAEKVLEELKDLKNIKICGFMCIAPFVKNQEENRSCFKDMKKIFDKFMHIKENNIDIKYLSMGMTNDYETAIEEGANIVRIGTGVFGSRSYN